MFKSNRVWMIGAVVCFAGLLALAEDVPPEKPPAPEKTPEGEAKDKAPLLTPVATFDALLAELKATKAKIILLSGWSAGSEACLKELPVLAGAAKSVAKDLPDLVVLGLCVDGGGAADDAAKKAAQDKAAEVVKAKALPFKNLLWTGRAEDLADKLGLQTTPHDALLSPEGKVLRNIDFGDEAEMFETTLRDEYKIATEALAAPAEK